MTERGIEFYERDRGFMNSIYMRDPNGMKVELACYRFEVPEGFRAADVLMTAHRLRVERDDHHIVDEHVADAIEYLLSTRDRLPSEPTAPSNVRYIRRDAEGVTGKSNAVAAGNGKYVVRSESENDSDAALTFFSRVRVSKNS